MDSLSALKVKNAKAGRHVDGNVRGLHLVVMPSGSRSWVLRIEHNGRRRDLGLGGYPDVGLEQAREKARALRTITKSGGDPIAARDKDKVVIPTFRAAAIECHKARESGWKSRTANAFLSTLELHVFPGMGNLRVDSVDERDIVAALSPLWSTKPAAARKLRQRIGTVLDFARGMGWRAIGSPRDGLRPLLSRQVRPTHFAAMPYGDVRAFVAELNAKVMSSGKLALLFAIFTAARSGEVRSARWSHIDFDARQWRRPAGLMKAGEQHIVTLSPQSIAILRIAENLRTSSADVPIFPGSGGRPLSDMTMGKYVKPLGYTVHGFRSSFRDWAAEQMPSIPDSVAEAALAHRVPNAVIAAYKRAQFLEMRRSLLDAWGNYVEKAQPPGQGRKRNTMN